MLLPLLGLRSRFVSCLLSFCPRLFPWCAACVQFPHGCLPLFSFGFSLVVVVPFSSCPLVSGSFFVVALLCSNVWIEFLGQPLSAGSSGRACLYGPVGPVDLVGNTFSFLFFFSRVWDHSPLAAPPPQKLGRRGIQKLCCFGGRGFFIPLICFYPLVFFTL